ncbi:tetratricopeptide repeat protein [Actinosynnema sp. NPDC020468]|uniref:tetratricopeptide repeat protein n=1 Tax=Actinosynnema sp. NPDC020468 TaxID=3154488 RepID=UPI0033CEC8A2
MAGLITVAVPVGRMDHEVRGRSGLVASLRGPGGRIVVLHGPDGVGKSTVAAEHARGAAVTTWWLDAAHPLARRELALRVGAPVEASPAELWAALDAVVAPWLLVLDDAEPAVVARWLRRPKANGTVLITSTSDAWPGATALRVPPLPAKYGAAVLLDLARHAGDRPRAEALAAALGGSPLELRLAGRFLAAAVDVPVLPGELLPRTFASYPVDVPAVDLAARRHPAARPLLEVLSGLAPTPIPPALLDAEALRAVPGLEGITADELGVLLADLVRLGLVDRRTSTLAVHPLVRRACRGGRLTGLLDVITARDESVWAAVLPLCTDLGDSAAAADVRLRVGRSCRRHGLVEDAERLYRSALATRSRLFGEHHPAALEVRASLVALRHDRGEYARAADEYRSLVALLADVLGPDHELSLVARANLGVVLWRRGELAEAEAVQRDLAGALGRVFGPEHGHTLAARQRLGHVLRRRGELERAEVEYRFVAVSRRRQLGDHPDTAKVEARLEAVILDRLEDSLGES